jgi:hypothetical protein
MKNFSLMIIIAMILSFPLHGQVKMELHSEEPGTLESLLPDSIRNTIEELTLTGNIDVRDFVFITYKMRQLTDIDMCHAQIMEYTGTTVSYQWIRHYPANEIPRDALLRSDAAPNKTLKNIRLPNSIKSIGASAFYGCQSMITCEFPVDSIQGIEGSAFASCMSLLSIRIPKSLTVINKRTFSNCNEVQSIEIPDLVKVIDEGAFSRCLKAKNLSIGVKVDSIYDFAFYQCYSLQKIYSMNPSPPKIKSTFRNVFTDVPKDIPVYVPDASVELYRAAFGWKDFSNIRALSTGVEQPKEYDYEITVNGKQLLLSKMQDKAINIYNLQGQEIFSKIRSNEQEDVLLPAKGIYLLKVDQNCRKLLIH